jgi:hypothetical protein
MTLDPDRAMTARLPPPSTAMNWEWRPDAQVARQIRAGYEKIRRALREETYAGRRARTGR